MLYWKKHNYPPSLFINEDTYLKRQGVASILGFSPAGHQFLYIPGTDVTQASLGLQKAVVFTFKSGAQQIWGRHI